MRKFTSLGLNAAKNTDYNEKCFKQKLFRIKFPIKKSHGAYFYLTLPWSGAKRSFQFQYDISNMVIFGVP